ncbi:Rop guanine nucleotide exchange factor 3 [Spatholobus suberectus]|nr:Rop guanine nucleotide exchange factor 3 [Spatholobus suberectus]
MSGRTSLGNAIYRYMYSVDKFSPGHLLCCLKISSKHEALELAAEKAETLLFCLKQTYPKSRMNPVDNPPPVAELFGRAHTESTQLLLEKFVYFKVGFMVANIVIANHELEEKTKIKFCIVDFEIGQGMQYVHLLNATTMAGKSITARTSTIDMDNVIVDQVEAAH